MLMNTKLKAATLLISSALTAYSVQASSYSDVIVFGDSLSDVGNLHALDFAGGPAEGQTYGARFSNGPVLVEYIASSIKGIDVTANPLSPSLHLTGNNVGTNYAVAGAKSLDEDGDPTTFDTNLPTQINAYLAANNFSSDSNALYLMTIGGNDIRAARDIIAYNINQTTTSETPRLDAYDFIYQAAEGTVTEIAKLAATGAQDIILINAPDIGAIPETPLIQSQVIAGSSGFIEKLQAKYLNYSTSNLTNTYNALTKIGLAKLTRELNSQGLEPNIQVFDFNGIFQSIIKSPSTYDFTNVSEACNYIFSAQEIKPECFISTDYLFFDEVHPTTKGHSIAAAALIQDLQL
ncbi:SGNH/GDSL hydrolase family protein [Vibrio sp.]|nr:SGNH/GDSL hydrolase family protein [Vibrio sp.]